MSRTLRIALVLIVLVALAVLGWRCVQTPTEPDAPAPVATPLADAVPQSSDPSAQRIEADLRRLADPALEGRETGTPGFERAAALVAARMAEAGLRPAGDDGTWFQRVPLLTGVPLRDGARLAVERDDRVEELRFSDDFLPCSSVMRSMRRSWTTTTSPAWTCAAGSR